MCTFGIRHRLWLKVALAEGEGHLLFAYRLFVTACCVFGVYSAVHFVIAVVLLSVAEG